MYIPWWSKMKLTIYMLLMLFTMIVIYMKQIHPSYYAQQCNLNHASNFPRWYGSMTPLFGHSLDTIFRDTHLNNCWFMSCIPLYPMSIHYIPIYFSLVFFRENGNSHEVTHFFSLVTWPLWGVRNADRGRTSHSFGHRLFEASSWGVDPFSSSIV